MLAIAVAGTMALATPARAQLQVRATLEVTDLAENPITTIQAGEAFLLRAIVQDIRDPEVDFPGVFAAYIDVAFDPAVAAAGPGAMLEYGPTFAAYLDSRGDLSTPGQIISGGTSTSSIQNPGSDPQLLWSVVLHAEAPGTTEFTPSFSTLADPFAPEWLLYGMPDGYMMTEANVEFVGTSLSVVPEPSGLALAGVALAGLAATFAVSRRRKVQREG